mmetsp:Transcript_27599/g.41334  ORF Transcript_27599/g.41334 Transcript_27599/m.41334 type:complete len:117 (+) Transcript_27599:353-703(+)
MLLCSLIEGVAISKNSLPAEKYCLSVHTPHKSKTYSFFRRITYRVPHAHYFLPCAKGTQPPLHQSYHSVPSAHFSIRDIQWLVLFTISAPEAHFLEHHGRTPILNFYIILGSNSDG